jgi:uncharacterized protein YbjT (DUF2867 family)
MDTADKKLIAVMGATGAQGGAVIQAFHKLAAVAAAAGNDSSPTYEIRAITRNPNSEKAKALVEGMLVKEVVKADADDEESLTEAFQGCYGAFVVTDFWQGTGIGLYIHFCSHAHLPLSV